MDKRGPRTGLPKDLTREHVLRAIREIDVKGWEPGNDSIKYDLVFEGERYPPKIVVKYANFFAHGELLDVSKFSGGEDTTNVLFRALNFEIDLKPKFSKNLLVGAVYSREDLKTRFKITDATINNGIFKPKMYSSVWLFVTEEKTPDRTQYRDFFDDNSLHFEGQTKKRTDHLIIDHEKEGNEVLVFYRRKRDEFPNFGFKYLGKFEYVKHDPGHSDDEPSKFLLYPVDLAPQDEETASGISPNLADKTYAPSREGKERTRIQTVYERSPKLRAQAVNIHGTTCKVCGFNFGKAYGEFGDGYIEIHHMIPISSIKDEHEVDPSKDLVPVCSNCHRMIHKFREKWMTIQELREILHKEPV
jgi:5-methylcytosine-specific restriction protein A